MVLAQLGPPCTQEYKWRELEEQRQAQKLQRQLQQEQAYLLSLQQSQNLDSSKPVQQQSSKPPQSLEADREKSLQTPDLDASKQPQSIDSGKTRPSPVSSLEKTTAPQLPVADLQGRATDSEPFREVNLATWCRHPDCCSASFACVNSLPLLWVCCVLHGDG